MSILENIDSLGMKPWDFQQEVLVALSETDSNRKLLVQPTGTGKTVVFLSYALLTGKRTMVIVHNDELIDQTLRTIRKLSDTVNVGKFVGNVRDWDAQILVASLQTIKNPHNLVILDDDFELFIYDEAHHATSPTSKRVFYRYGLCDLDTAGHNNVRLITPHFSDTRELIGVTATPIRTDKTPLGKIFHDRVDAPNLEWFISHDYLCDLKFLSIDTGVDLSDVRSYLGDLSESDIAKKLISSGYINELARVVHSYCQDSKSIIVYVPNVKTAKLAAGLIHESGLTCDYVVGAERKRRKDVIDRFKSGDLRVLVNCLVLKEGFDAPNADAILLCRPTKSSLLLTQMIGRLTRNSPETGKTLGKVIDLVFRRRQEDIISASEIFSDKDSNIPASQREGLSIRQRIILQAQRKDVLGALTYTLDRVRHQKQLIADEEIEKRKRQKRVRVYDPVNMPDSIQLLVDTRILRDLDMDYKEFQVYFKTEITDLRLRQQGCAWIDDPAKPKQIDLLCKLTNHTREDISIMSWLEAQCMINLFKSSQPITQWQLSKLMQYQKDINSDLEIPRTKRKASQLIDHLTYNRNKKRRGYETSYSVKGGIRRGRA